MPGLPFCTAAGQGGSAQAAPAARHGPAPPPLFPEAGLEPLTYRDLPGWHAHGVGEALAAFRRSCSVIRAKDDLVTPPRPIFTALRGVCRRAAHLPSHVSEHRARAFFEMEFRPFRITPLDQKQGFLTGYYEPEIEGSRVRTDVYATPLYRRPPDLILEAPPSGGQPANRGKAFRRVDGDPAGQMVPYYDRAAIEDGALADKGLELVWIKEPADAFFAQIQGSVRVRLADGEVLRLNYDGHNGQPYTPVGRLLIEQGLVPREKMSMDAIRAYITEHPEAGRALMRQNRSYVFFRVARELKAGDGAVGAQGLPLAAGRAIAVDKRIHVYGTPFFIRAELPTGDGGALESFSRLMIAQDTGSAIVGPARADIFFGAGGQAGSVAGRIQHPGEFVVLLPRTLDPTRRLVPLPKPRPAIPGPSIPRPVIPAANVSGAQ
ncbi:murein transglycosylase A [Ancylobacter amanitiformis]|uniref:peptidoglycan lytic exotransglycosylase n=1 Tax=Ancylobacter amanitiformis TaxID=217069 RepID=A0ABU0LR30_9HYPH|nr:murein transglycosylase A [Ancylobacter amanitiformis]MDQ0511161.1 membrane-bound lytic murein transglycosylase A [Ancylobacter amanitiformis]